MPNITVQQYKPSEVIAIFNNILVLQNNQARLVCIRGLYFAGKGIPYNGFYYDVLRDESSVHELPIKISEAQRKELTPNNLVEIIGTLGRKITTKSEIKLELNVSRVEILKEQVIDENEIKRIELRQKKTAKGFKNVDMLLEGLLYTDQRPKIALLFADTSITMTDFVQGGGDVAKVAFDFVEFRENFSRTNDLVNTIKRIDSQSYSAIAIVRGGGSGIEKLEALNLLEAVANMETPVISAIGHPEEKLFIKVLVDKVVSVPNDLGHYFKNMMETVNEKKTKSQTALTEQIKKQFKEQLEASQKQNKELQEKLAKLIKSQEEQTKKHNEQVLSLNKIQSETIKKHNEQVEGIQKQHKEQLEKANKQSEELRKQLTEQMGRLQIQLRSQTETSDRQSKEFNDNLRIMQTTNSRLQEQLSSALRINNVWKVITIIVVVVLLVLLLFR